MEHLEGTMEVVGIEPELTEIIMSMCNEIAQLRLAFDASLYLKFPNLTWERLYELKQESWNAHDVILKSQKEQRIKERKEKLKQGVRSL